MHCHFNIYRLFTNYISLLLISLFFLSCGDKKEASKKDDKANTKQPTIVDAMIAQPSSISDTVEANGTVIANETVELHPQVTGRLIYLNVPEGQHVQQGTVLARVYDADLRAQVVKSQAALQLAQTNEKRLSQLLDIQGVNQADYDAVVNQVAGYKADIQYTNALIDKTVIRAPFSGTIGLRQVSPGAFVTESSVIATLQQTTRTKIDFTLPEEYSNIIKVGNKIGVEIDKARQTKNTATIIAVEPQVNQSTRNLIVRALLDDGSSNPGAFVKVYIGASVNKDAILIPTNAIMPGDQSDQVILVKDGKAKMTDIQTGSRQSSTAEITKGIQQGDTVVITGVLFARPNSDLKVRSIKTLEQFVNKGIQ